MFQWVLRVNAIEIIIVSYQRIGILKDNLSHILSDNPNISICLGLQGVVSEDDIDLLAEFFPRLRILHFTMPSITKVLNTCVQSSKADYCLLFDDDAFPLDDCMQAHHSALASEALTPFTVGREIRAGVSFSWLAATKRLLERVLGSAVPRSAKSHGVVAGWVTKFGYIFGNYCVLGSCALTSARACNMGLNRGVFQRLGGFNESFEGNCWGFETEYALRLRKQGLYGRYVGSAAVLHYEFSSGGSRAKRGRAYITDFAHNQGLLVRQVGKVAWLLGILRLMKVYCKIR